MSYNNTNQGYSQTRENGYDTSSVHNHNSGSYSSPGLRCPLCKQAPSDSHIGKYGGSSSSSADLGAGIPTIPGGYR